MNVTEVENHYRGLLAPIYRWMVGDFQTRLTQSRAELVALGIGPSSKNGRAVDLGAGNGLQAIPLAELGYQVLAVDSSEELLRELRDQFPYIRTLHDDFVRTVAWSSEPCEVIVCMGDTLTHLAEAEIAATLTRASQCLTPGGKLVLTFRDYASQTPEDTACHLVQQDDSRILTVSLQYFPRHVRVTDIVHERSNGAWRVRASSYRKLRLPISWVTDALGALPFRVQQATTLAGWITIVGVRR